MLKSAPPAQVYYFLTARHTAQDNNGWVCSGGTPQYFILFNDLSTLLWHLGILKLSTVLLNDSRLYAVIILYPGAIDLGATGPQCSSDLTTLEM